MPRKPDHPRRPSLAILALAATLGGANTALAAAIQGLHAQPELSFAIILRIVAAMAVTLLLAAGSLILLRRFAPRFSARRLGGDVKVLGGANITRDLRAHVIEYDSIRILVVEGRSGIGLTVLSHPSRSDPGNPP